MPESGPFRIKIPLLPRTLAIALMVAGVVGFVVTLLLWRDRVPLACLLVSTLITFIGLGLIVARRRYSQEDGAAPGLDVGVGRPVRTYEKQSEAGQARGDVEKAASPGVDVANRSLEDQPARIVAQSGPTPPTAPLNLSQPYVIGEPPVSKPGLLEQVITSLQASGAEIKVESQRHGRAILSVTGSDGQTYTALVDGGFQPIGISEIRSLQVWVNKNASAGGFLFSSGPFTPEAYEWAGARKIRLVMADELDEISL